MESTNVADDRIAQLELALARIDGELQATRRCLATVETTTTQATPRSWVARSAMLVALCILALVATLGLGTASAANPQNLTVKSLSVAGPGGVIVARLNSDGLALYRNSQLAAGIGASESGGALRLYDTSGNNSVYLHASKGGAGDLVIAGSGDTQVRLGESSLTPPQAQGGSAPAVSSGPLNLRFYKGGHLQSAIGEVETGGVVQVNDLMRNRAASLTIADSAGKLTIYSERKSLAEVGIDAATHGGIVNVMNSAGQAVVSMTGHANAGYFAITNAGGNAVVEAGLATGGVGIVRVFPQGGLHWFIEGKQPK